MNLRSAIQRGKSFQPLCKRIGSLLALAGVVLVVLTMNEYAGSMELASLGSEEVLLLGICLALYAAGQVLLGASWHFSLGHAGVKSCPYWAVEVYGTTQLAKYIPGSVFHFAGRQAMGLAKGYPAMPLLRSTIWEQVLQCLAALPYALLLLPMLLSVGTPLLGSILFTTAVGLIIAVLSRTGQHRLSAAFGCDVLFLGLSALIFVLILEMCRGDILPDRILTAGIFISAWLVGVVVPGAPAGAGVREASLLYLLAGSQPEADILLAALLSRGVTVGGDLGFYCLAASLGLARRKRLLPGVN